MARERDFRVYPGPDVKRGWLSLGKQEEHFFQLFKRYDAPLRRFFAGRGCRREEEDDLVQETLLGAFLGIEEYAGKAPFEAWLFGIAANVVRKHRRSRRAQKRSGVELSLAEPGAADPIRSIGDGAADPLRRLLGREELEALTRAASQMPTQMRTATWLRVFGGLSYREIAEALELSVGTVKTQLSRARSRIRRDRSSGFRVSHA